MFFHFELKWNIAKGWQKNSKEGTWLKRKALLQRQMAHSVRWLFKILTDLIKIMYWATEMVVLGRHMRLQKGTGAVKVGKPFSSRQGKLQKSFLPCTAANPSRQRKKPSQTAALTEASGATRLHASLPLFNPTGVTHMLSPHLCYICTTPFPLYWVGSEKKKQELVERARNLSHGKK